MLRVSPREDQSSRFSCQPNSGSPLRDRVLAVRACATRRRVSREWARWSARRRPVSTPARPSSAGAGVRRGRLDRARRYRRDAGILLPGTTWKHLVERVCRRSLPTRGTPRVFGYAPAIPEPAHTVRRGRCNCRLVEGDSSMAAEFAREKYNRRHAIAVRRQTASTGSVLPASQSPRSPVALSTSTEAEPVGYVGSTEDQAEKDAEHRANQALAQLRRSSVSLAGPGTPDVVVSPESSPPCADERRRLGVDHLRRTAQQSALAAPLVGMAGGALPADSTNAIERLRGSGQPLAPQVRRRMEEGFGTSFADVRTHDGPDAARLSQSVSARAFTTGPDIFFGRGQYAPETQDGERVLAHELAHTLQPDQRLRRLPASCGSVVRRIELLPTQDAPITVHVNDYHFIDRMTIGAAPANGDHDVIIKEFGDFNGLAIAAAHAGGEEFEFDDVRWGWRGKAEIYPKADKREKVCVRLSAVQIAELKRVANEDDRREMAAFVSMTGKLGDTVAGALHKVAQKPDPSKILPLDTNRGALTGLPRLHFGEGKYWSDSIKDGGDNFQAFLWGPNGSREEGPHLHLFFACKAKREDVEENDHPITLRDFFLTTKSKKHLRCRNGNFVDKSSGEAAALSDSETREAEELVAVSQMLVAASAGARPSGRVTDGELSFLDCLKSLRGESKIRIDVLRHFLTVVAGLSEEDVARYTNEPDADEGLGYTVRSYLDDLGNLARLDTTAVELGLDAEEVVEHLTAEAYPYDGIDKFYDDLIRSLKEAKTKQLEVV